jgi:hypothetical protein
MAEAANQAHAVNLTGFFLKAAHQQHVLEPAQPLVTGGRRQLGVVTNLGGSESHGCLL